MKSAFSIILIVLLSSNQILAQELFPLTEPASTLPKGVIGIRSFNELYKEFDKTRVMNGVRLMYGINSKLTLYATITGSNHHKDKLPTEFPYHNTPERGVKKPYFINGFSVYGKYRFLSTDAEKEHLRMAAYSEFSTVNVAHDEGEPRLMDDTKGIGVGLITTYLKNKFAISATIGGIYAGQYKGVQIDPIQSLPDIPTRVKYGNAINYALSVGYLIYPSMYKDYKQLNINLYCEFMGKTYDRTKVYITPNGGEEYQILTNYIPPALLKNHYLDISPGVQFIIHSNWRIDLSTTLQLLNNSYAHLYPVYNIGIQRYIYR